MWILADIRRCLPGWYHQVRILRCNGDGMVQRDDTWSFIMLICVICIIASDSLLPDWLCFLDTVHVHWTCSCILMSPFTVCSFEQLQLLPPKLVEQMHDFFYEYSQLARYLAKTTRTLSHTFFLAMKLCACRTSRSQWRFLVLYRWWSPGDDDVGH